MGAWGVAVFSGLAALGFLMVLWIAFGALLLPIAGKQGEQICFLIHAKGNDTALAETVRGLIWLRHAIGVTPCIVIVNDGMDPASMLSAQQLILMYPGIKIVTAEDVQLNNIWKNKTDS